MFMSKYKYIIYAKGCVNHATRKTIGKSSSAYVYQIFRMNVFTKKRKLYHKGSRKLYECPSNALDQLAFVEAMKYLVYQSPKRYVETPCTIKTSKLNIWAWLKHFHQVLLFNNTLEDELSQLFLGFAKIQLDEPTSRVDSITVHKTLMMARKLAHNSKQYNIMTYYKHMKLLKSNDNNRKWVINASKDLWSREWINLITRSWIKYFKHTHKFPKSHHRLLILSHDCNYTVKTDFPKDRNKLRFLALPSSSTGDTLVLVNKKTTDANSVPIYRLEKFFKKAIGKNIGYLKHNYFRIINVNMDLFR